MGTEILRPQDCLAGRIRNSPALFARRRGCNYGNSYTNSRINPNPSPTPRTRRKQQHTPARSEKSDQKRRSGQPEQSSSKRSSSDDGGAGRVDLVMEKVTILRRGASLDSKIKSKLSLKKDVDQPAAKQVHSPELQSPIMTECDVYAGFPFGASPEPSSLPLPSFSKKTSTVILEEEGGLVGRFGHQRPPSAAPVGLAEDPTRSGHGATPFSNPLCLACCCLPSP